MTYENVQDIWPEVLEASQNGKIKWEKRADGASYVAVLDPYSIEIEWRYGAKALNGIEGVFLYVWNERQEIVSSFRAPKNTPDYEEYLAYFRIIQKQYLDAPRVLDAIVKRLKE